MASSRFIWTILGLIAAILCTSILLGIYLQRPGYPFTVSLAIVLLAAETAALFLYLLRIRKDLLRLVHALRNEDPTLQFARDGRDPFFSQIHREFNRIIRDFRLIRLDREAEHQFFRATVEHIRFGILAYSGGGKVELVNHAFLELFRMDHLDHIDQLSRKTSELPRLLRELEQGTEMLQRIRIEGTWQHLIFLASRFGLRSEQITLVSVRDISREINRNEMEAWQKLLRVLRHEILNSITPIRLLAGNLTALMGPEMQRSGRLTPEGILELRSGLETIHRRSEGLSNFLDIYSSLYSIPEFRPEEISADDLLGRIKNLFADQLQREGIRCTVLAEDSLPLLKVDIRLVEQVLINLVKNAIEAVRGRDHREISLVAGMAGETLLITVKDNGEGIARDQLESIFIPFYTTREGGNGIGLSFCQHIMTLHQGQLKVQSTPGQGSEFKLVFKTA